MAGLLVANGVLQGLTKDIDLHVAKALSGRAMERTLMLRVRSIGAEEGMSM